NFRPGGVKVHAGAPILELGMTEGDFAEMAAAGVRLVGEIGLGSVKTGKDAAPMVRWARAHGMTVTIHTGGPSIAGSSPINADVVLEAAPDVVGHINGGTTSMTPAEIERLVATDMALEIVQCGNVKTALHTLRVATDARATHRIIVGNDAPSGTGVIPLGVLRTLALLAALGGLPPAEAIACATGNTARVYQLGGGTIAEGREADLVVCDAPAGGVGADALSALAAGDLPGISMILIDGTVTIARDERGVDKYAGSRAILDAWLARGVWRREDRPAIYPYTQTYRVAGQSVTRRGFVALGEVSEYKRGVVLPHERTHAGPKKDRLDLLTATRADLGLLFMLVRDPEGELLRATAPEGEPLVEARDLQGELHRLWRITDEARVAHVQKLMEPRPVIIADGHHRYETAIEYARRRPEATGKLMAFFTLEAPGLTIFPNHR